MSFTKLIYHLVFAPKNRLAIIDPDLEHDFYLMLYNILLRHNAFVYRIGGMPDHVHILVEIPAQASVSKFVQAIKRESSYMASAMISKWPGWQEGYGGFTCGFAEINRIKHYISNQKEHHKILSFDDEYRQWLLDNGVSPNAPYFPK